MSLAAGEGDAVLVVDVGVAIGVGVVVVVGFLANTHTDSCHTQST